MLSTNIAMPCNTESPATPFNLMRSEAVLPLGTWAAVSFSIFGRHCLKLQESQDVLQSGKTLEDLPSVERTSVFQVF